MISYHLCVDDSQVFSSASPKFCLAIIYLDVIAALMSHVHLMLSFQTEFIIFLLLYFNFFLN